jgi:hypothetical protein
MAGKPVTQIQPTANRGRKLRHVSLAPAPPGRHTSAGRDPRLVKIKRRRTLDDRLHCSPPSARPLHINRRPRASGTNESDRRARSTLPSSGVTPHARLKTGSRAPRQKDRRYGRRPDHPPFQDPGRSATALKELIATATPRELPPIARARLAYAPDATAPAEWDFRWSCDREAIRTLGRRLLDHESDGAGALAWWHESGDLQRPFATGWSVPQPHPSSCPSATPRCGWTAGSAASQCSSPGSPQARSTSSRSGRATASATRLGGDVSISCQSAETWRADQRRADGWWLPARSRGHSARSCGSAGAAATNAPSACRPPRAAARSLRA